MIYMQSVGDLHLTSIFHFFSFAQCFERVNLPIYNMPTFPISIVPRIMGNQELEEKIKNNNTKVRPNNKEVIISDYVESDSNSTLPRHPTKKINPSTICRKPRKTVTTGIYDRRAHFLAYAQELRKAANPQQVQWLKNGSKPKHKHKVSFITTPMRLRRPKGSNRRKYQGVVPEVDISCNSKWNSSSKSKGTESQMNLNTMRKLRDMLKGLWDSKMGSEVERKHHQAD